MRVLGGNMNCNYELGRPNGSQAKGNEVSKNGR